MSLAILLDDALRSDGDGFSLRVSLPWIRSLPLASLHELRVTIDGQSAPLPELAPSPTWWFVQDRIVVHSTVRLEPGQHEVLVGFKLLIPNMGAGPNQPLILPFAAARRLELDAPLAPPRASRDLPLEAVGSPA
ncbi:hypothetical protein C5E10_16490 [Pseudoclavibacter sp. RFBG4]|uniref:hypothetical protein n=1 Tax=Pseudoclavibacter sp. RFBG4 TaxID=2080575 RepID=UPI000CE8C43B|nr:hypothetical protein [Pseudoclavibacter sp. RFBG4]PPG26599.1 hypothetical protein C5E10_16490 [Pseudoclavibacter sp. RFBG4]